MPDLHDVLVIGAGPTGLACAIEARRAGLSAVNVEKGCLVDSLWRYPTNLVFFTTAELLEIGDVPFASVNPKPTRAEIKEALSGNLCRCTGYIQIFEAVEQAAAKMAEAAK